MNEPNKQGNYQAQNQGNEVTNSPSKIRGGQGALNHVMNLSNLKPLRRQLRTYGTPAEGALWNILKGKKVARIQFRRQYSVDKHILDFYCPSLKIAIELDGDYHHRGGMPEQDINRDEELKEKYGIRTLRFENKMVFQQPEAIVNAIEEIVSERRDNQDSQDVQRPPTPL